MVHLPCSPRNVMSCWPNTLTSEGIAPTSKRFFGRAQHVHPAKRALTAPRFKQGRQSDFCVSSVANSLEVRQVQKQARRIQSLMRARSFALFGPVQNSKCAELWAAIRRSSGFKPDFPRRVWKETGVNINLSVSNDELDLISENVSSHANRLARARWRAKKAEFSMEVEHSWKAKGGRFPFWAFAGR